MKIRSKLIHYAIFSFATFLILIAIHLLLPGLFLLLQVPTFAIGNSDFLLLRWKNNAAGSGLEFNLLPLVIFAAVISAISLFIDRR